ncbi:MAG: hypothetical protein PUG48_04035 [Clostridia bacterium]|nr:hypothetical protein [Clostridia bacterium]
MKKVVKCSVCLMAFIMLLFTFVGCSKENRQIELGKYYLNGDTSQRYIEFYENEQFALMNFDGLEFAKTIFEPEHMDNDVYYQHFATPVINSINKKISYKYDEDASEYTFSFMGLEDISCTPFTYSATGDSPVVTLAEQEYILVK